MNSATITHETLKFDENKVTPGALVQHRNFAGWENAYYIGRGTNSTVVLEEPANHGKEARLFRRHPADVRFRPPRGFQALYMEQIYDEGIDEYVSIAAKVIDLIKQHAPELLQHIACAAPVYIHHSEAMVDEISTAVESTQKTIDKTTTRLTQ